MQKEYSSTIDEPLIISILSEYDLNNPGQLAAARSTLDLVKGTVAEDDETGFDPSAASGPGLEIDEHQSSKEEEDSHGAIDWKSQTDDTTPSDYTGSGSSQDFPTWEEESPDTTYTSYMNNYDNLDDNGKMWALTGIFTTMKPFDITWALKKYKGNFGQALDELMFQSFLEESGARLRGVDGFSGVDSPASRRKGKRKANHKNARPYGPDKTSSEESTTSKWQQGEHDIEFISAKTGYPKNQITSMFHKNGESARNTVAAIIAAHRDMNLDLDDPLIEITAYEIQQDFPSISKKDLEALVQITQPSEANARALAKTLSNRPTSTRSPIQLEFSYAPLNLTSESIPTNSTDSNASHQSQLLNYTTASENASSHRQARDTAFTQAHSAWRKGKSDRLMGAAAAYYSQVGHDHNSRLKSFESQKADALVAGQSIKSELDLHGVNVKDALRISRERVTSWWHELEESRKSGRGRVTNAYKIVTGVGNHSEGGRGKLGPAVGKMLLREGWKVQVATGALTVTGVGTKKREGMLA